MPITPEQRAAISRANGARSKGPTTPDAIARCRDAARAAHQRKAAAITLDCTLLPSESRAALESISALELSFWAPSTPTELQMVHEIIDINWRIRRIRYAQTHDLHAAMDAPRVPAHRVMPGEQLPVRVGPERFEEPRRALDVGENERHGSGRKVPLHADSFPPAARTVQSRTGCTPRPERDPRDRRSWNTWTRPWSFADCVFCRSVSAS